MRTNLQVKQELLELCCAFVEQRIGAARQAIEQAQASANEETKSSAGDKYETGRAMAQLEIENSSAQLAEAMNLKRVLEHVNPNQEAKVAHVGSIVRTNAGNYFIAISAGKFVVDGESYYAVSAASPVGARLMKLAAGSEVTLNQSRILINAVS